MMRREQERRLVISCPASGLFSLGGQLGMALLLLTTATSCRNVLGIDSTSLDDDALSCLPKDAPEPSGPGVSWWSGCDADNACFSAKVPQPADRPAAATEGTDLPAITLAFAQVMLGARNSEGKLDAAAWKNMGFDLDGICTAAPTCSSVTTDSDRACKPLLSDSAQDGELCRDNQLGLLDYNLDTLPQTRGKYMATASQTNCALCRGGYNLLIKLSGYNGSKDDPSVRVDLYPSPGLETLKDVDCSKDTWDESACWSTEDPFTIDQDAVEGSATSGELGSATFYDPSAFVRDGWLVAQLPENTPFGLVSMHADIPPVVRIAIGSGLLVAQLQKGTDGWVVPEGVLAGSTRMTALLEEFSRLGLCEQTDPAAYALVKTFMESAADLLSTGARSANTPCDALSLGLSVTAREATVGPLVPISAPSSAACSP
jgi:hypothetical protein